MRRVHDRQGQGLSGEWAGDGPRPWRRLSRALSRGGADGHGGRRRAAGPASRRPVAARRYAGFRHRAKPVSAGGPSNGADDSFAVQRSQSRALPLVASCDGAQTAPPLTLIFHGKPIGTYQIGRSRLAAGQNVLASGKTACFRRSEIRYSVLRAARSLTTALLTRCDKPQDTYQQPPYADPASA
jgi:hypothetical protein